MVLITEGKGKSTKGRQCGVFKGRNDLFKGRSMEDRPDA